jgi:cytochrome c-type biogenesis protein CcmI
MGLLLTLVTLPVSAPVGGALWIAEQVHAAAEREYYDEEAIRGQLEDLEERFAAGELVEDDYEAAADELLERLLEAHAFWADQQAEVEPTAGFDPMAGFTAMALVDEERPDA